MSGLELARHLALLGADTMMAAPEDQFPFGPDGPNALADRWQELGRRMAAHEASPDPVRLRLQQRSGLSTPEYWLVMLCAAAERYPEVAVACGILMDTGQTHLVTPLCFAQLLQGARQFPLSEGLCLALDGGTPARLGLLAASTVAGDRPLTHQPLRLVPRELPFLLGVEPTVSLSRSIVHELPPGSTAWSGALLRRTCELLESEGLVFLRGPSWRASRQLALDVAEAQGLQPRFLAVEDGRVPMLPVAQVEDELPVIDASQVVAPSAALERAILERVVSHPRLLVLAGDGLSGEEIATVIVPALGSVEAERIWERATNDQALATRLAARFRVSLFEAVAVCRHAIAVAAATDVDETAWEALISEQVLQEGSRRMGRLVTCMHSTATLEHLVVPEPLRIQLRDIIDWQRHSTRVFGEMGLGSRTPLGRGLTCLFSGPPGTGKTFAAQCLANELGLNLYRLDLSQVVSKYIGETEKSLATIFDEAEAGHGILFFDEADALFGKRSDVKDAHDRYANIEVGYLLQRLEAFTGVAILATNLRSNIDAAFIRRIRFLLEFPLPDRDMRRQLWEQSLPGKRYRADDLQLDAFVERFRLSGGSIQNVGLAAAHMAAATSEGRITVPLLVRATYRELEKSGQSRDRASFGPLGQHLPQEVA